MIPRPNTNLAGAGWNGGLTQDVVVVGDDNHVYDVLFWDGGSNPGSYPWLLNDITVTGEQQAQATMPQPVSNAATPRGGSALAVFTSPEYSMGSYNVQSVGNVLAYIGGNDGNPVVEAVYLDLGNPLNLTQASSTQDYPPAAWSSLAGWGWLGQGSQHVVYVDNNNHVSELYSVHSNYAWSYNNLSVHTGYTGTSAPRGKSPLAGYAFENQETQHVFYIAQDNTVRELAYSGKWSGHNLSLETKAPSPMADGPLVAYVNEYDSTQHVIYIAGNGDIQELWWSSRTGWVAGQPDLTRTTGAPMPAANSALAGYSCEWERSEHVIYVGSDGDLYELYNIRGSWATTNLSGFPWIVATPPIDGTPLTGYSWVNDHTQHVFYIDINKNVHELYRQGDTWATGVLSGGLTV